jgi:hypothetical protein
MNCDQVFAILTRGPFPTGEWWDELVETHLETCADCWRLADALRPALEVFQEAVPPAESRDLPGYWGDARPAANVVAELTNSVARAKATSVRSHPATHESIHGVRRYARLSSSDDVYSRATRISPETVRAAVLASTLTATAIGAGLVWWLS